MSAPVIKMMRKHEFIPGMGLGMRLQGIPIMVELTPNLYAFGLGYKPTLTDYNAKEKEAVE